MEHRGPLTAEQQNLLGDCLFGCDACTAACPPPASGQRLAVDLEWLLLAPAGELRRRIAGTALALSTDAESRATVSIRDEVSDRRP